MQKRCVVFWLVTLAWISMLEVARAQPVFRGTQIALSIERFMGVDYTDFEGPGRGDVTARMFLNASERVPTNCARLGFDVFIKRLSLGAAGGVTSDGVGVFAPRIGYLFGLTSHVGLWLRAGGFFASAGKGAAPNYFGMYAEVLLQWFPYSRFALHLGPTIDMAFADDPHPHYVSFGMPQFGMTAWF
jgi:hypothetical protein